MRSLRGNLSCITRQPGPHNNIYIICSTFHLYDLKTNLVGVN